MDEMRYRLERWVLLAAPRVEDSSRLRGLLHLATASETIADCAMEMVWIVEKGEEVHPVLSAAIGESDEIVLKLTVSPGSPADGKTLDSLKIETETGMYALAVNRGGRWTYRPRDTYRLQGGDSLLVTGAHEGLEPLAELFGQSWRTPRNPGRPTASASGPGVCVPHGITEGARCCLCCAAVYYGLRSGSQMDERRCWSRPALSRRWRSTIPSRPSRRRRTTTGARTSGGSYLRSRLREGGRPFQGRRRFRRVSGVEVSPRADEIKYPSSRKWRSSSPQRARGREEFTRHGPHQQAKARRAWTVRFYVDERGPSEAGRRRRAKRSPPSGWTMTWALNYVYTGDQVGWNLARGVRGAYGKQANYWWVWLPLALAFAAAFWRTDRLFAIRNLDIVALLGFLVSHGFFRR